ncbi:K7_Cpt1p [Saccharomyces cerevisiae Kyokai no. 7]|uniref:diacylglycerol cholinephosphotransferase n=1 Tax=Saccharomyces cerevisiae (strain Kyokai no. 7 / NBRC 101557) TaxID=721032 RepID=G2WLX6_YEASK|nr:K7_Cpt1p [Saccharomyces cerevisiae Kyokai no. 7]
MGFFIPQSSLGNLKLYKYQSDDRSFLSNHVLRPFWRKFATIFPLWMAPNLVTLLGFCFIIFNVLTTLYYDPYFDQESPRWTYFSYAIGLFLYQTFDACDGMHARRTGQQGPLGELFDHCIDSINTTLSMIPVCSMTGMGYTYMTIFSQFAILCSFYLSTWEEYHTHKLYLAEFCGPVEGIIVLCISFIAVGIYGPQTIWHTKIAQFSWQDFVFDVETVHLMYAFCTGALIFNIVTAHTNVVRYYESQSTKSATPSKTAENISKAVNGLLPFFAYFSSIFTLVLIQPSFISLALILSIGFSVAFVVGRMIIAHLTMQPFPMVNFPFLIPTIQLVLYAFMVYVLDYQKESIVSALVWMGLGLTLAIHGMFINDIIYDITTFLDIYALSIKHPKEI